MGDGVIPSLVYPELVEGRYELYPKGSPDDIRLVVAIEGGRVTEVAWPDA